MKNIFEIIEEINRQGTTILLVEQNVFQSLRISHRAYVLETGRVVLSGDGRRAARQRTREEGLPGDVTMADTKLTVGDWMTRNPITIEDDASIVEAIHLLQARRTSAASR